MSGNTQKEDGRDFCWRDGKLWSWNGVDWEQEECCSGDARNVLVKTNKDLADRLGRLGTFLFDDSLSEVIGDGVRMVKPKWIVRLGSYRPVGMKLQLSRTRLRIWR